MFFLLFTINSHTSWRYSGWLRTTQLGGRRGLCLGQAGTHRRGQAATAQTQGFSAGRWGADLGAENEKKNKGETNDLLSIFHGG